MLVDVTNVEFKKDFVLWLRFEDGTEGEVDVKKLLGEFSGVFSKLSDQDYFRSVSVNAEIGTISWPGNIDLCPDVLYSAVKGESVPNFSKANSA